MIKENIIILILALMLDFMIGDPYWFYHPVRIMGKFISFEEKLIRKHFKGKKMETLAGVALLLDTALFTAGITWFILSISKSINPSLGFGAKVFLTYTTLSIRSLHFEGIQVKDELAKSLERGRKRVSNIVGRDTENLSEEEVVKATIETIAENTTDGVISPMFYILLLGPIGAMVFKAVSTLDSMVGYRNEKYEYIGKASAKADDLLNYLPARICGALMVIAAYILRYDCKNAWHILTRDHGNHKSPNSAWSESAVAGALNIKLGGTHDYWGVPVYKPTIGDERKNAETGDIHKTIKMMYVASFLFVSILSLFIFWL
jgi:adenosylcobinamide-phosphate synthase